MSPSAILRVNSRDGLTHVFDLCDEQGKEAWAHHRAQASFQREITAVTLEANGAVHHLPFPSRFRGVAFDAWVSEDGHAAYLAMMADDVKVVLRVNGQGHRITMTNTGTLRWAANGAAPVRRIPR